VRELDAYLGELARRSESHWFALDRAILRERGREWALAHVDDTEAVRDALGGGPVEPTRAAAFVASVLKRIDV
jgi:hypothetical protein